MSLHILAKVFGTFKAIMSDVMTVPHTEHSLVFLIDFKFSEENLKTAVELLMSIVGYTESLPGCQECMISKDLVVQGCVRFTTAWRTGEAFRKYVKSEEFRRVLVTMDMCSEEPKVSIGGAVHPCGIAYLSELRESP